MSHDSDIGTVFGLVSNETRLDIIHALWRQRLEDGGFEGTPISFSTIREEVGVQDPGRFNYHLDKLVPHLVREHEDGYSLTSAGARVIGAAISGAYSVTDSTDESVTIDDCPKEGCEGAIGAEYHHGHIDITCRECALRSLMPVPPILVDHLDIVDLADGSVPFTLTELQRILRGFCLLCDGPLERTIEEMSGDPIKVAHTCQACGATSHTTGGNLLIDHPEVVAMLHDASIDYRHLAPWEIDDVLNAETSIQSQEPVEIKIDIVCNGESRTAMLDEQLNVHRWLRG